MLMPESIIILATRKASVTNILHRRGSSVAPAADDSNFAGGGPVEVHNGDLESAASANGAASEQGPTDREYIRGIIIDEILGAPLQGIRQFFFMIDPYKPEQFVRAPKLFDDINMYFAVIYYVGLILYTVYSILLFYQLQPTSANAMVSQGTLSPIVVNITISCSAAHACGNYTKMTTAEGNISWSNSEPITITQVWDHSAGINAECTALNGVTEIYPSIEGLPASSGSLLLPVCYSPSIFDGVFITIPFTSAYTSSAPYASVVVTGATANYTNNMYGMVTLSPSQSKIAFYSQTVTTSIAGVSTSAPYVGDLFYNGKGMVDSSHFIVCLSMVFIGHATSNNAGSLALQLQQFGYKTTFAYPATILTTLGAIGGFANVFLVVCSMIRGFFIVSYKVVFRMKGVETRSGGVVLAIYLLFVGLLRCIGLVPQE
jgi:hypothetical protein